jgi:hypothetical protein
MYILTLRRTFQEVFTFVQDTFLFLIRTTNAEKDVIPVRNVYDLALEPKKIGIYDCSHTDLYNKEPWIAKSTNEAIDWFKKS